jgi:hypothetical protein
MSMRTVLLALLGLVLGAVVGVVAFDRGPDVEVLAVLTAAVGLAAGIAVGRRRRA